jgi:hypothetical protein
MEKEKKKAWTRPQLIVAVRGKPEESVLLKCKSLSEGGPGGFCGNAQGGCLQAAPS